MKEKRYSTTKSELGLQGAGKFCESFPHFVKMMTRKTGLVCTTIATPTPPPRWLKSGIGGLILLNELIASKRDTGTFYRT